jgi:hypothetical protein
MLFYLVFRSPKWFDVDDTKEPIAMFWKKEDFIAWVYKIGDIHEAYDVVCCKRNEDGMLEILGRM